jgi:hypothetical protein
MTPLLRPPAPRGLAILPIVLFAAAVLALFVFPSFVT